MTYLLKFMTSPKAGLLCVAVLITAVYLMGLKVLFGTLLIFSLVLLSIICSIAEGLKQDQKQDPTWGEDVE